MEGLGDDDVNEAHFRSHAFWRAGKRSNLNLDACVRVCTRQVFCGRLMMKSFNEGIVFYLSFFASNNETFADRAHNRTETIFVFFSDLKIP